jgi:Tfp pilus assembly protein PilE
MVVVALFAILLLLPGICYNSWQQYKSWNRLSATARFFLVLTASGLVLAIMAMAAVMATGIT